MMETIQTSTPAQHKDRWRTPPEVMRMMETALRITFDLDAAASPETALVDRYICDPNRVPDGWSGQVDALKCKWDGRNAWINPPFSSKRAFMAAAHKNCVESGLIVVGPLPYTPDTSFWQWVEQTADTVFLPTKRISYLPAPGYQPARPSGCSFYSAIVLWTPWAAATGTARHCRINLI